MFKNFSKIVKKLLNNLFKNCSKIVKKLFKNLFKNCWKICSKIVQKFFKNLLKNCSKNCLKIVQGWSGKKVRKCHFNIIEDFFTFIYIFHFHWGTCVIIYTFHTIFIEKLFIPHISLHYRKKKTWNHEWTYTTRFCSFIPNHRS